MFSNDSFLKLVLVIAGADLLLKNVAVRCPRDCNCKSSAFAIGKCGPNKGRAYVLRCCIMHTNDSHESIIDMRLECHYRLQYENFIPNYELNNSYSGCRPNLCYKCFYIKI